MPNRVINDGVIASAGRFDVCPKQFEQRIEIA